MKSEIIDQTANTQKLLTQDCIFGGRCQELTHVMSSGAGN